eukprot:NODE_36_length_36011_cov_1.012920.p13 type:complete len:337 gc:universal NODE_36_length_36011_cov_1.012920:11276-10266(-)
MSAIFELKLAKSPCLMDSGVSALDSDTFSDNETFFDSKQRRGKSKNSLELIEPLEGAKKQQAIKKFTRTIPLELLNAYRNMYKQWILELKNKFNIILYGVGNKQEVIKDFDKQCNLPMLHVNGYEDKNAFKHLVRLQKEEYDSDDDLELEDNVDYFEEYINNQPASIIVVQGIEVFCTDVFSIKCLRLAFRLERRMLITLDDPMAIISLVIPSCVFHNITTGASYTTPISNSKKTEKRTITISGVESILSKLNKDAPKILKYIVDKHIENVTVSRKSMMTYFKSKLVSSTTINAVLEELVSHNLVKELNNEGKRILALTVLENQYQSLLEVIQKFK